MKKKMFNVNKLVEAEGYKEEGFPFKILFDNKEKETPYAIQELSETDSILKIFVDQIPYDYKIGEEISYISKERLIELSKLVPPPLKEINTSWKKAIKFSTDDRLIDSNVTAMQIDKDNTVISLQIMARPSTRRLYATHYETIKDLFRNFLGFAVTKDLLDIVKEQTQYQKENPNYKKDMLDAINTIFKEVNIEKHLDNALLQVTNILQGTLKEFLIAYGQVLTENYLKLYDILTEEEIPKVRSLSEMNYLPEEFMIQHLTRIYRSLSSYVKNNEKQKQQRLLRVLIGQGRNPSEKQETESFELKLKNKIIKLRNFLIDNLKERENIDDFIKILDKNIEIYSKYLEKDLSSIEFKIK